METLPNVYRRVYRKHIGLGKSGRRKCKEFDVRGRFRVTYTPFKFHTRAVSRAGVKKPSKNKSKNVSKSCDCLGTGASYLNVSLNSVVARDFTNHEANTLLLVFLAADKQQINKIHFNYIKLINKCFLW